MRQCLVRVKLNLIIGILQYLQQEKTSRKKKKGSASLEKL